MAYKHFGDFVDGFSAFESKIAMTFKPFIKTERLSYGQLQTESYKTANYLISMGMQKGDRLMIVAPNSPQWLKLFLGCQLIGVILVPVDVRNSLDTANNFARQTRPKLIFKSKSLLPQLGRRKQTVFIEDLNELINGSASEAPNIKLNGEETALIVFTSGTTAAPKGVVLAQNNILANVEGVNKAIKINSDWRILSVLPLSHMYELTGECCMLSAGSSIFYLPRILPLAIAKALNDYQITTILAVPQLLILFRQRILQTAEAEGQARVLNLMLKLAPHLPFKARRLVFSKVHKKLGGHLELVITGGAPIPVEVADFWECMGVKAVQGYGLTETAPILTVNHLDDRRTDSQGLKLHNVELKIGKNNEILVKGPNVFKGYWQNPKQTRQVFTKNGWFKTGDIGRLDDDWLRIQGRAKFAIVLPSGLNVFPEDIEVVAEKHPAFKEICIVGVLKADGEVVQAVIVSEKSDAEIDQAIADINTRLESYQYISDWVRWPDKEFPRTLLLKVDRKNIQLWANNRLVNEAKDKNLGIADPLTNIIRLVSDKPDLEVKNCDRLADVGLDSLRRLTVISLIEEQLGVTVNEQLIGPATTTKQLRRLIMQGSHLAETTKPAGWQYQNWARSVGNCLRESLIRGLLRLWVSIKVEGTENLVNLSAPAIYIFNHVDYFDAAVVFQALPKNIRNHLAVAAADDIMNKHKLLIPLVRLGYAGFNLNRQGAVLPSLEHAAELIGRGWNIAIAPEGQITRTGKLQAFKSGIGLLAVETGAVVIPIKTTGLYGTFPLGKTWPVRNSRVSVKIGQPISFNQKTNYHSAAQSLYQAMKKL